MGEYSKYIDSARRSTPTPDELVDGEGKCVFGTFDSEFKSMELLRAKKPTRAPQFANRFKLTLWEATEVFLENGILLAAVCDMGLFGKTLCIFYDKRTRKVSCWDHNLKSKDTVIAPNLLNGSESRAVTKHSRLEYANNFAHGECRLRGEHTGKDGAISYSFELNKLSPPSVVSIPFGKNRPLYTEKEFFKAEGELTVNGEKMRTTQDTCAVVDDHRGYYPRKCHYDWLTTMGKFNIGGKKRYFAFNLTHNQSLSPEKYNENLIWFEGKTSILPPVSFAYSVPTKDFAGDAVWTVKDEYDMVNLTFGVRGINPMVIHAAIIQIDYFVAFGELTGYVRDEDGNKIMADGLPGMGEDKTMLF